MVPVSPSSTIGQQSGGYMSRYRRCILEERQRNKAAKSLQQKALDNKRMNVAQYSEEVRRNAKMRAARRAQLHFETSAGLSSINALSNVQDQVQNNSKRSDQYYSSSLMATRRKQLITTESERIRQQRAARDQATQRMRQRFSNRREKHTISNNTTYGGGSTATTTVKPQDIRAIGEERPPALNGVVPFQSSSVNVNK